MHRNSPCQSQRILGECTQYLLFYLLRVGLALITDVFPYIGTYFYDSILIGQSYMYLLLRERNHLPYLAIVITLGNIQIILNKHHLCAYLKRKLYIQGIKILRKISLYLCLIVVFLSFYRSKSCCILLICFIVMSG